MIEKIVYVLSTITRYWDQIQTSLIRCRKHLNTNEWNLTHHLACELERIFSKENYDVDIELVKYTKERPDIVIHKRDTDEHNEIAIEVKPNYSSPTAHEDIRKLRELMLKDHKYKNALFVVYLDDDEKANDLLNIKDVSIALVYRDTVKTNF